MLGLYDNPRTPDLELVNYTDYDDLPTAGYEYAQLNGVGVWRDDSIVGSPWVPMELDQWSKINSVHADTYVPGAPPSGWLESINGGSITMVGGKIRIDSSATANKWATLQTTIPPTPAWPAGHDLMLVARFLVVQGGTLDYVFVGLADTRAGATMYPKLSPRNAASTAGGLGKANSGVYSGATIPAQTSLQTYVLRLTGSGADDLCFAYILGQPNVRCGTVASAYNYAAGGTYVVIPCTELGGVRTILDVEFVALYSKAP